MDDLSIIKLVVSEKSGKVRSKKIKKNILIREGCYDYIMNRFDDTTPNDSLHEIIYRIVHHLEEKPKCKYCGKPCTFDPSSEKYDEICEDNECISKHLNISLPKYEDIDDEYIKNLICYENSNEINPWYMSVTWTKTHGIYKYLINRYKNARSIQESAYMIVNNLKETDIPICPICKKEHVRFLSLKNGYGNTCETYTCALHDFNRNDVKQKDNITDEDIIKTFISKHDDEKIICMNRSRLQEKWIYEHGYKDYLDNRYPDSESFTETVARIFYHIEERPVCKKCGGHVNMYEYKFGKDFVFRQYCSSKCVNNGEDCIQKKRITKDKRQEKIFLEKGFQCKYIDNEFPREHLLVYNDCKIHNPYKIRIGDFYNRYWKDDYVICPICNPLRNPETSIETIIKRYLDEFGVNYIQHYRKLLKDKKSKEVDFYLEDYHLAIECNGNYWHSGETGRINGLWKYNELKKQNIELLVFWEDDIRFKKEIVKNIIRTKLGLNENKIFARKCQIREVSSKDSKDFIDKYHIQGNINASIRLGLYYNDELVEIMTFGKLRKSLGSKNIDGYYELYRLCTKENTTVVGGSSKLFKYFIEHYNPYSVISYCHKEISNGNVYNKIGMTLVKDCRQGYSYFSAKYSLKRVNRFVFRKDKIDDGSGRTEGEILADKGFVKCYDLGSFKFEYLNNSNIVA